METAELIRRAIHCDNTGQPNMAMLYMTRARETNAADRETIRRQRVMLEASRLAQPIIRDAMRAIEEIWPAIVAGMKAIGDAMEEAGKAFAKAFPDPGPEVLFGHGAKQAFSKYPHQHPKGWLSDGRPVY